MEKEMYDEMRQICSDANDANDILDRCRKDINATLMAAARAHYVGKVIKDTDNAYYKVTEIKKILLTVSFYKAVFIGSTDFSVCKIDVRAEKYEAVRYGDKIRLMRKDDTYHYFMMNGNGEFSGIIIEDFNDSDVLTMAEMMKDMDGDVIRNNDTVAFNRGKKIETGQIIDFDALYNGLFTVLLNGDEVIYLPGNELKIIN